jgi:tetratricopeptide (TPR) repeat protein
MNYLPIFLLACLIFVISVPGQTEVKDTDAILNAVRSSILNKPNDKVTLVKAAGILYKNKLYNECVKTANTLIALDDTYYWGYSYRHKCRSELFDYKGALEDGMRALEFMPLPEKNPIPLINLDEFPVINKILLGPLGSDKNIFSYYERLFELFENKINEVLNNAPPDVMVNGVVKSGPTPFIADNLRAHLGILLENCAHLYDKKGQDEKAVEILSRLVQTFPKWQGLKTRASYFVIKQQFGAAVEDITSALDLTTESTQFQRDLPLARANTPAHTRWRAEMFRWRGDLYVFLKQFDKAFADFETSKALFAQVNFDQEVLRGIEADLNRRIEAARQKQLADTGQPK